MILLILQEAVSECIQPWSVLDIFLKNKLDSAADCCKRNVPAACVRFVSGDHGEERRIVDEGYGQVSAGAATPSSLDPSG